MRRRVRQQSVLRHRQLRRYSRGRGLSRSDPASGCEAASRFMQDGAQDRLSKQFAGLDWPSGNRAMARALAFKGYDYQLVMGRGSHNPKR